MNLTFDKQDNNKALLTIDVVESDYADKVKKQLKHLGATHSLPGFRKGHVPFGMLEKRFGKEVASDVINNEVYDAAIKYLQDNKIDILGAPVPVDVVALDLDNKKDYTFKYELAIAPALDIEVDKNVTLPYYTITVSDEMINEQDQALCKRFGAQVPGEEFEADALVKGSIMELNEDGTVKETEDAIQVVDGIVAPMYFKDKAQAEKFTGKKVGDKVVFNPWATCEGDPTELSSMLQIDKDKAAEVKGDFELSISEIIVLRPAEHNEEFYTNVFGKDKVKTEDEYRAAVKQMIADQLRGNSENLFQDDVYKYYTSRYDGDIVVAEDVLKKWYMSVNKDVNDENIDSVFAQLMPDLRWQLIRDSIAEKLGVKVEEADMLQFATMMARQQFAQYGMSNLSDDVYADYAKRMLADKNSRARLAQQVGLLKIFEAIRNAVTIDNKDVTIDEFKALVEQRNAAANA